MKLLLTVVVGFVVGFGGVTSYHLANNEWYRQELRTVTGLPLP